MTKLRTSHMNYIVGYLTAAVEHAATKELSERRLRSIAKKATRTALKKVFSEEEALGVSNEAIIREYVTETLRQVFNELM